MKVIAVVIAFLVAGASAWPNLHLQQPAFQLRSAIQAKDARLVTGSIVQAIEDAAQSIRDAGLDPLNIDGVAIDYAAPVPTVFSAKYLLDNLELNGLSNIVVRRMNYAILTSRLTFDIQLPEISLRIGNTAWDVNVLSGNLNGAIRGSYAIKDIVLTGDVRVSIGVLTGVSIRDFALAMSIGDIDSYLNVVLQGIDISRPLNEYLGERVPRALNEYQPDINELLTIVGRQIAESIL